MNKENNLFMKRRRFNGKFLYECITWKNAKIGDKFNTVPCSDPFKKSFEIVIVTKRKFSAVDKNDCVYVWCKYLK